MSTFERTLKVGKTDAYSLDVSEWANSEDLISFSASDSTGSLTIVSSEIDGTELQLLVTGLAIGTAKVEMEFATATRSDCTIVNIRVIAGC